MRMCEWRNQKVGWFMSFFFRPFFPPRLPSIGKLLLLLYRIWCQRGSFLQGPREILGKNILVLTVISFSLAQNACSICHPGNMQLAHFSPSYHFGKQSCYTSILQPMHLKWRRNFFSKKAKEWRNSKSNEKALKGFSCPERKNGRQITWSLPILIAITRVAKKVTHERFAFDYDFTGFGCPTTRSFKGHKCQIISVVSLLRPWWKRPPLLHTQLAFSLTAQGRKKEGRKKKASLAPKSESQRKTRFL